jgi:large subunit ribosomal protein L10
MVTKQQKEQVVAELVAMLQGASGLYLLDYSRMTVAESNHMRSELRKKDLSFKVAKNRLIQRALAEVGGFEIPEEKFFGQTGIVVGYSDPIAPAKIIKEVSEKSEKPKLKAAVIEGQLFDGSQLKQIAELPTREDMIAGILGSLDAPISGIVGSINAVMRDVAYLVEEVAKKQAA